MITIGIVGTWKNTGKTTTLSHLLRKLATNKVRIAVTGIGYDGEEIDNITALPKPRLLFDRDTIVTTSEKCLENVDLYYKILDKTNYKTALGNVNIIEMFSSGMIVVAGPNKKSSLQSFFFDLEKYGVDVLFIDGSLNRIAPLSIVDYIIFATGASRSQEINFLAEEMASIEFLFSLPLAGIVYNCDFIQIKNSNGITDLAFSSVFDSEDAGIVLANLTADYNQVIIPKIIADECLDYFNAHQQKNTKICLVVESPIAFLLSGNPIQTVNKVKDFIAKGNEVKYLRSPKLQAVTVNPFYPKPIDHYYITEYVDKDLLLNNVQNKLKTKVYNIKENSSDILPF